MPRVELPPAIATRPFSTREARALDVGRGRLRGPDVRHPFRGANLPANVAATLTNRCAALQARLPLRAFFSGVTAALIMGVPLPSRLENDARVHVSVPRPHTAPTGKFVVGHVSSFDTSQAWNGVRLSPPARAWCELATTLRLEDVVAAGDYLIHHELPLTSRQKLEQAASEWGQRAGCATLREALTLLSDRSESAQESALRVIILRSRLKGLAVNLPIRTSGGFNYRADLAFPEELVIVEYQSRFHDNTKSFASDMTRKSRLEVDGWHVLEVNARDLDDRAELVQRIRRVLKRRAGYTARANR
jgi:very-short-patch-repair endonuclease